MENLNAESKHSQTLADRTNQNTYMSKNASAKKRMAAKDIYLSKSRYIPGNPNFLNWT